jgi:hypothetical protein
MSYPDYDTDYPDGHDLDDEPEDTVTTKPNYDYSPPSYCRESTRPGYDDELHESRMDAAAMAETHQDSPGRMQPAELMSDTTARRVASEWHGGGGTALYALASTGAIDTAREGHDIRREIADALPGAFYANHELIQLDMYVKAAGSRGPVDGWDTMAWEDNDQ